MADVHDSGRQQRLRLSAGLDAHDEDFQKGEEHLLVLGEGHVRARVHLGCDVVVDVGGGVVAEDLRGELVRQLGAQHSVKNGRKGPAFHHHRVRRRFASASGLLCRLLHCLPRIRVAELRDDFVAEGETACHNAVEARIRHVQRPRAQNRRGHEERTHFADTRRRLEAIGGADPHCDDRLLAPG